jgi:Spore Coat Protein U domain
MVKRIILIIAIAMIAFSGVALAVDSNTLTVTANVVGTCKFNSATSTLGFGALDPNSSANATATTTTTFWCTKGATVQGITHDNGSHFSSSKLHMYDTVSTDLIAYSLTLTQKGTTGLGKSTPIDLQIDGLINNADFVDATEGSYSDTVVLTFVP